MSTFKTDLNSLSTLLGDAVAGALKDAIKAELMIHAEKIVEDTAVKIAEGLKSQVELYETQSAEFPFGQIVLNIWVGPVENKRKLPFTGVGRSKI